MGIVLFENKSDCCACGACQSILELTGLTDRIVRDLNDFSYIDHEIDFKEANEKIGISRIESIRILEEMLTEQIGI